MKANIAYIYYLASQNPDTQRFMVENGNALLKIGFSLFHTLTLSQKSIEVYNLILNYFDSLHETGLDRVNIEHLAGRNVAKQNNNNNRPIITYQHRILIAIAENVYAIMDFNPPSSVLVFARSILASDSTVKLGL